MKKLSVVNVVPDFQYTLYKFLMIIYVEANLMVQMILNFSNKAISWWDFGI